MPIHDLCFKNVVTLGRDATIAEAAGRMKKENVGALVVVEGDLKVAGIVTDRDLVVAGLAAGRAPTAKITEVMSKAVLKVPRGAGIADVIEKMEAREVRRALVVDENGRPCGMISTDDLLQLLGNELNSLGRLVDRQLNHAGTRAA